MNEQTVLNSNKKTATHYFRDTPRLAYCGYRNGTTTNMRQLVSCASCVAALHADGEGAR